MPSCCTYPVAWPYQKPSGIPQKKAIWVSVGGGVPPWLPYAYTLGSRSWLQQILVRWMGSQCPRSPPRPFLPPCHFVCVLTGTSGTGEEKTRGRSGTLRVEYPPSCWLLRKREMLDAREKKNNSVQTRCIARGLSQKHPLINQLPKDFWLHASQKLLRKLTPKTLFHVTEMRSSKK